jgi:PAS domain S-box-containing protein
MKDNSASTIPLRSMQRYEDNQNMVQPSPLWRMRAAPRVTVRSVLAIRLWSAGRDAVSHKQSGHSGHLWRVIAVVGVVLLPQWLYAQTETFGEAWRWVHFSTQSGLPSDVVYDIAETQSGTVWAGTEAGLAWYDGFVWHAVGESQGAPPWRVVSLVAADTQGKILAIMNGQLFGGDTTGFRKIPVFVDGVQRALLNAVPFDEGSVLLLLGGPPASLYVYREGELEELEPPSSLGDAHGARIWRTSAGRIWLNASGGLYRWTNGRWVLKHAASGGGRWVAELVEDETGTGLAFVASPQEERGLWEWEEGTSPGRVASEGLNQIVSMDIGPRGEAVAVYGTGFLSVRRSNVWAPLDRAPPEMPHALFLRFRRNGDLWVGTRTGLFLHRQSSRRWANWTHPFPDPRNHVNVITRARDGPIWIGTGDGVEIQRADGSVQWIGRAAGTRLGAVTGLAEDVGGNIWISSGSSFQGAYRWDGNDWRHFGRQAGLAAGYIHKIESDREGRLWFLGLSDPNTIEGGPGAFAYENGRFEHWGTTEGLPSGRVYAFEQGPDSALWFGTAGGLSRWSRGTWTHWTRRQLRGSHVFTLAVDDQGRVWFGDRDRGLGYVDRDDVIGYLTTGDGLINDEVWDIQIDEAGRLWIATDGGLCSRQDEVWSCFTTDLGLLSPYLWPVLPGREQILLGTRGRGLQALNPEEATDPTPRVFISDPVIQENTVHLRWDAFAYWGSLSSSAIETRYRVDGAAWSTWSVDREVAIEELSSGTHSFEVQAKGLFGRYGSEGQRASFAIPLPLYLRPVFAIPVGGLSVALIALAMLAVLGLHRSKARYRAVIEDQTDFIVRWRPDGTRTFVNDAYCDFFGGTPRQLIGANFLPLVLEEERKEILDRVERLTPEQPVARGEHQLVLPDGTVHWQHWTDRGIFDAKGHLIEVQSAGRDITERKRAEEAHRESEERLEHLSAATYEGIAISEGGVVLDANEQMATMFGYRLDEVIGKPVMEMVAPEYREVVLKRITSGYDKTHEHVALRKDGSKFLVEVRGRSMSYRGRSVRVAAMVDITERRKAERALKESEAKLRVLLEAIPDMIFRLSREGTYLEYKASREVKPYVAPREFLGKNICDVLPSNVGEQIMKGIITALETGETQVTEYDLASGDGICHFEARLVSAGASEVVCVVRDITERKRALEALRVSEEKFSNAFRLSPDVIAITTFAEGKFVDVNDAFVAVTGHSREQVIGRTVEDIGLWINPEQRNSFRQMIRERGRLHLTEVQGRMRSGAVHTFLGSAATFDLHGGLHVLSIFRDVTEREQAQKALRISEEKFFKVFRSSPDAMSISTLDEGRVRFVDVNDKFVAVSGYTRDEIVGRTASDLRMWVKLEDRDRLIRKVLERGRVTSVEMKARMKSGELRTFLASVELMDLGGELHMLAVHTDITEREVMEQELRSSHQQLERLSRRLIDVQETERGHIARELHDEIGQALTAVKLNLQAVDQLFADSAVAEKIADSIAVVDGAVEEVRNLALDLRPLVLDDLGLVAALRWCGNRMADRAGFKITYSLAMLHGRPSREIETACFRVAQEALTNVVRHADARQVNVVLRRNTEKLELLVRDDGIGFDMDAIEESRGGHALIGIVGMLERVGFVGGEFAVESGPGQGTVVRARFPLVSERVLERGEAGSSRQPVTEVTS